MSDGLRELLYPLGFLSSLAFGGRFLLQWITSEIERKSVVTRLFWQLSLLGNLLLLVHSFIQIQFHVCAIQGCNAVISWRNLNLMGAKSRQVELRTVICLLAASVAAIAVLFTFQGYLLGHSFTGWFKIPAWNESAPGQIGMAWHLFGTIGLILFSGRFWVQWWSAEKAHTSYLGKAFWWLSLAGGGISLLYFVRIDDPVNIVGPACGLIPYFRNLMLLKKQRRAVGIHESA